MISSENRRLKRRSWRNWILLSAVTIITTFGLITAMPPLLNERIDKIWPWEKTDLVLLIGLSLIVLSFVIYLTQHQRHIVRVRHHLEQLREEREECIYMQNARLTAMHNVSGIMSKETDIYKVFDGITQICLDTFKGHRASLMLVEKDTGELVVCSVRGHADKKMFSVRQKIGEGIAGWSALHRKPLLLGEDLPDIEDLGFELSDKTITSAMVVPIIVRNKLVGVLNITAKDQNVRYTEDDLKVLTVFAENAGAAIRHTEHTEWMRDVVRNVKHRAEDGDMNTVTRRKLEHS